ncbi:MAG: CAT RNA binding domain-containing protein [Enterococcus sp.]
MLIEKVFNNNVVLSKDELNREVVVMGKGLAFQKHVGDFIAKAKIDKVFCLTDHQSSKQFQELLKEVPMEYLKIANKIIEEAKQTLEVSLNDSVYRIAENIRNFSREDVSASVVA